MTWTKEQLEAMQLAGVPVQKKIGQEWVESGSERFWLVDPPNEYRPRPGFMFSGEVPSKLQRAGIPLEQLWRGEWVEAGDHLVPNCHHTYRIADTAAEPERVETVEELGREIKSLQNEKADAEKVGQDWHRLYMDACKERDDARANVELWQGYFEAAIKQRNEAQAKLDQIHKANAMLMEALQ